MSDFQAILENANSFMFCNYDMNCVVACCYVLHDVACNRVALVVHWVAFQILLVFTLCSWNFILPFNFITLVIPIISSLQFTVRFFVMFRVGFGCCGYTQWFETKLISKKSRLEKNSLVAVLLLLLLLVISKMVAFAVNSQWRISSKEPVSLSRCVVFFCSYNSYNFRSPSTEAKK